MMVKDTRAYECGHRGIYDKANPRTDFSLAQNAYHKIFMRLKENCIGFQIQNGMCNTLLSLLGLSRRVSRAAT